MQYAQVSIEATLGAPAQPPVGIAAELAPPEADARKAMNRLWRFFSALAGKLRNAKVRVRVDAVTDYAASITLAVTQANIAVGEYIDVVIPGRGSFRVTAVTSGPDVTLGQFVSQTSNAVTATNMAAAVNGMIGLKDIVVATTNSGDLILTAREGGEVGNGFVVIDGTVNGISGEGNFAGGLAASARVTAAIAITHANLTASDTVTIGSQTFTAVASGATGNQFNIGADATADAAALATVINANAELAGLVTAVASTGTVTLTYLTAPRISLHIRLSTSDATAFGLTQPATNLTLANQQTTRTYDCGA